MLSSDEPYGKDDSRADNFADVPNWLISNDVRLSSPPDADTNTYTNADKNNIHNKKRYEGDEFGAGTATASYAKAPL